MPNATSEEKGEREGRIQENRARCSENWSIGRNAVTFPANYAVLQFMLHCACRVHVAHRVSRSQKLFNHFLTVWFALCLSSYVGNLHIK